MKKPHLVWLLIVVCALCPAPSTRGQGDDVLLRENDEGVTTGEERRAALAVLTDAARRSLDAGEPATAARLLNRAGRLQLLLNRHVESLALYREALSAVGRWGDRPVRIDSLNGMAAAHAQLSECDEAQRLIRRAVSLSDAAGYAAGKAEALLTLSECQDASDHELALTTAQESLALWQSVGSRSGVARALSAIGGHQLSLNRLAESEQTSKAALELSRELGLWGEEADSLINLAFVEYRKGGLQDSLLLLTQAEDRLDDPQSEPYRMGQITGGMAEVFIESGLPETGLVKLHEAREYFRQTGRPVPVMVLTAVIGKMLHLTGEHKAAFDALRQALADAERHKEFPLVAMCHEYLGRTYAATGEPEAALAHFRDALSFHERVGNRMEAARTVVLMGQVYQQGGKFERARSLYEKSLATFRGLSDHVNEAATLYTLGSLELERGDAEAAEGHLRQSIEVTEKLRRAASTDLTAAFSAAVHERYEKYVECLMRRHRAGHALGLDRRAFEATEMARGRSLSDVLRATGSSLVPGLDPELAGREQSLRQSLRVKEDERVTLLSGNYKKAALEALDAEMSRLGEEHERVEEAIRARHPAYAQVVRTSDWDLRRIQEQVIVEDETLLLEYSLGAARSYVWAVTRGGLKSYELPPREIIEAAVKRVYELLSERPERKHEEELAEKMGEAVRELSRMILSPVADELRGRRRVVVAADGALNYVPFQLLSASSDDGGDPLVAGHEVVNVPSASILGQLREEAARRRPHARTLAAFGDPVFLSNYAVRKGAGSEIGLAELRRMEAKSFASNLRNVEVKGDLRNAAAAQPLGFAALEMANLRTTAASADSFVASGFDATRERLQATDLSEFAVLHFATHGWLDPQHPENSGLLLTTVDTEGRERVGFVGLRDIYNLRAPVGLVVLSACRTALGKEVRDEGMIGLTRGFMYAGASGVVSSLWKVDDEATSELMRRFYENMLRHGMKPAEALGAAQNSIRQEPRWRSPFFWAAFTLQGEYRQVMRPSGEPGMSLYTKAAVYAGALSLLLLAAWWLRRRRASI
jgi:CHAT domain-containing protein